MKMLSVKNSQKQTLTKTVQNDLYRFQNTKFTPSQKNDSYDDRILPTSASSRKVTSLDCLQRFQIVKVWISVEFVAVKNCLQLNRGFLETVEPVHLDQSIGPSACCLRRDIEYKWCNVQMHHLEDDRLNKF